MITINITAEALDVFNAITGLIGAGLTFAALWFTYLNLKEIKEQFYEQNRGAAVFYISNINGTSRANLVFKNYGNSPLVIKSVSCNPPISWSKTPLKEMSGIKTLVECENIFLAPQQLISSHFDFEKYPHNEFKVTLEYTTCGKSYTEDFNVDLTFDANLLNLRTSLEDKNLEVINHSIQQLSDRFL